MPRRLTYTPKLGAEICTMIAEGTGLKAACEKLGLNRATVRGWIDDRPEFGLAYDQARRHRADHFQDEILEISDKIADCKEPAAVNAARLQVDSRRWLAAKLLPERFGDRQTTELTGAGGKDLIPEQRPVDTQKIALFLLGIFNNLPGGKNDPATLPAPPAMTARATTLLSAAVEPASLSRFPSRRRRSRRKQCGASISAGSTSPGRACGWSNDHRQDRGECPSRAGPQRPAMAPQRPSARLSGQSEGAARIVDRGGRARSEVF